MDDIVDTMIDSEISGTFSHGSQDVYVHIGEPQGPVNTALAFENVHLEGYNREEKSIFYLALDLVRGVIEKKIFFRMNQELSLIDIATQGYSITFFMEVLGREMENSTRHNYTITLFTMLFVNFTTITKDMDSEELNGLIKVIQTSTLRSMRKTDVVARWNQANFGFLLTHTPLEGSKAVIVRVKRNLLKDLAGFGLMCSWLNLILAFASLIQLGIKRQKPFLKMPCPGRKIIRIEHRMTFLRFDRKYGK